MIAHVRPFSRKAARCRADQAGLVLGALQVAAGLVNIERRHQATFAFTISLILKRCNFLSRGIGVDFFRPGVSSDGTEHRPLAQCGPILEAALVWTEWCRPEPQRSRPRFKRLVGKPVADEVREYRDVLLVRLSGGFVMQIRLQSDRTCILTRTIPIAKAILPGKSPQMTT
jgi:hypothetical protein